jgi:hypothetical protein
MSTQIYTLVEPYLDGAKLTEATTVKIDVTSKAQIQETIARGFAGVSPGAKMITVTIDSAVPSADFEYDPTTDLSELRVKELTLFAAGRSLSSKGFVIDYSLQGSVNSPSSLSLTFIGEFAKWE